jgi:hypothetical protein
MLVISAEGFSNAHEFVVATPCAAPAAATFAPVKRTVAAIAAIVSLVALGRRTGCRSERFLAWSVTIFRIVCLLVEI